MDKLDQAQTEARLTPELLGLVKKSTLDEINQKKQQQQTLNNGISKLIKIENDDFKSTNGKKEQLDNDDDCKIINEKINTVEQNTIKKETETEKVEIKLKPEEFILDDEEIGFPNYLKNWVIRGRTIPINKKTWTEIDIDGNDAILECPSQVVPLLIKKPNLFPLREKEEIKTNDDKQKNEDAKKNENENKEAEENNEKDSKESNEKSDDQIKNDEKQEQNKQQKNNEVKLSMLMIDDYYKSSVGNFLMGIGLRRCQEAYLKDSVKETQKLIKKEGDLDEHLDTLKDQQEQYEDCKAVNSIYTFKQNKCAMCDFKTDSESVMQHHLSIPHLTNRKEFKCNFCTFTTRDSRVIVYHFLNDHKKTCNLEMPLQLHECPTCNYESNQKAKTANHVAKCIKMFNEDKVQQTIDNETEYPAITSKLITQDDIKLYETTVQALKPVVMNPHTQIPVISGLPRGLQQQILIMQQQQFVRQKLATKPIKQANNTINQRTNLANIKPNNLANMVNMANILNSQTAIQALQAAGANGTNLIQNLNFSKSPQLYQMLQTGTNNQLLTNLQAKPTFLPIASNNKLQTAQLNRTIIPQLSSANVISKNLNNAKLAMLGKANNAINKETNGSSNGKSNTFVICEICDGYIKDLEQLRTHMQLIHKVKIHPKMLASRPPLNCQKCQWRFFTDQGLERHLLGAHGLITSNMQELVDNKEDGGRCIICGKVFTVELVAHMNQIHKITLRPAHLSYKCTVCSATFNLYRLFENHVYMVHSGSVKRISDDQLNQLNKKPRTQTIEIGKASINGSFINNN